MVPNTEIVKFLAYLIGIRLWYVVLNLVNNWDEWFKLNSVHDHHKKNFNAVKSEDIAVHSMEPLLPIQLNNTIPKNIYPDRR